MVELRVESIKDAGMPKDCFVSVRVGDTQKLSRLGNSRVYRFPQSGDRRFGKIEVFRRIGYANIDVDPQTDGMRNADILCEGFGSLGLKVAVEADEATKKKLAEPDTPKKQGTKVKAAKDYLSKHGLEVRLSEAMQAVLRDRPDDPAEFIAARLLGDRAIIFPSSKGSPQHSNVVSPQSKQPEQKLAPAPGRPVVAPFATYYKNHFGACDGDAFASIYSKFPTKAKAPSAKAAPVVGRTGPEKPVSVLPFKQYHESNFSSLDAGCCAKLYAKFPKPTALASTESKAAAAASTPAPSGPKAAQLPSVGTWLQPRRHAGATVETASGEPRAAQQTSNAAQFCKRPSVGTWLTHLPPAQETSVKQKIAALETKSATVAPPVQNDWKLKPSIGTWLAPKPAKVDAAAAPATSDKQPFAKKPSVGTWLAPRLDADTREPAAPASVAAAAGATSHKATPSSSPTPSPAAAATIPACRQRPMAVMSYNLMGPGFASMGVRPGVRLI